MKNLFLLAHDEDSVPVSSGPVTGLEDDYNEVRKKKAGRKDAGVQEEPPWPNSASARSEAIHVVKFCGQVHSLCATQRPHARTSSRTSFTQMIFSFHCNSSKNFACVIEIERKCCA